SPVWITAAGQLGVDYFPHQLLSDFAKQCESAGMTRGEMEQFQTDRQYHFNETKPLRGAINTDLHYCRIAQVLRLCRRSMSLAGLRLVSVTPASRLNDYFPVCSVERAIEEIHAAVGDPAGENPQGLYTQAQDRQIPGLGPMRDFRPHHWKEGAIPPAPKVDSPSHSPTV